MNILVLSENFLEGGLEKHIEEFANQGTKRDDRKNPFRPLSRKA
jgi:hypothetical protein